MKTLATLLFAGASMMASSNSLRAGTVYQEDFSSNPNWTTDQPDNFHWDQSSESYFVSMSNSGGQTTPSRYAFTQIDWNGEPFSLEWDSKITRSDWSAGINFGLFDNKLNYQSPSTLNVEYTHPDAGMGFTVFALPEETYAFKNAWVSFPFGTWLHNNLQYNPGSGIIDYEVTNLDNGDILVDTTLKIDEKFSNDMDFLGFTRYPAGQTCGGGFNCDGVTSGYFDNINFTTVPEPAALLLLGAGGLALLRRKK